MSGKGGLSAIPVLPQNLLAVKDENPKRFWGQICYLVCWLLLLILFILYAAFALADYLDDQDNPVITLSIKRSEQLEYPVFVVCPFKAFKDKDFFSYTDEFRFSIDKNGGLKVPNKGDEKQSKKGFNAGNTGSLFPNRKTCGGQDAIPDKKQREEAQKLQDEIADNIQFLVFRSLVQLDKENPGYYPCLVFNSDRFITAEDEARLIDPFAGEKGCKKAAPKKDSNDQSKKKGDDKVKKAFAKDVGYFDGYVMKIDTPFYYSSDGEKPADKTALTLSVSIYETVDAIEPTTAEYSSIGFPVGVTAAIFLKRIEFQCEECEDDEFTVFYNTTTSIIDLSEYPAIPQNGNEDAIIVTTYIQVFFESMTITKQQEVITQGPLDYLGNFAGMLGTLLSFSVLGSVDRLLSYIFIGNGALASVWDEAA